MVNEEFTKTIQEIVSQNEFERKRGMVSILAMVEDAKRAMMANAQFSALCLTFALVDECATFEWNKSHPEKQVGDHNDEKAYAAWFDMWESLKGIDEEEPKKKMEEFGREIKNFRKGSPYLDGQLLYKLRCSILHAVSTNIDFMNCGLGNDANRNIKNFTLVLSKPNPYLIGGNSSITDKNKNNSMEIDVQGLVGNLLHLVELYYKSNKDKIEFNTIEAIDYTGNYVKKME